MRKIVAYIAQSLDGYIAAPGDNLDWLDKFDHGPDIGYNDFYSTIDTVVMGRRTYDWVMGAVEAYPYPDKKSYVVSHNKVLDPGISTIDNNFLKSLSTLKAKPGKDIWLVGGANLINQALAGNLVDELRLTIAPILLGDGISLFTFLPKWVYLHLEDVKTHGQYTELFYSVLDKPPF